MAKKPTSVIKEDGSAIKSRDPGFSEKRATETYRYLVTARAFDERALNLQRQGCIGFFAPATGQEAALECHRICERLY